jgi:hypothetical protein
VPDQIPASWLDLVSKESGVAPPTTLSEDPPAARDDREEVDRVLRQIKANAS